MTEQAWLASNDSWEMLHFLSGNASVRKRRLFACARCRAFWDHVTDERSRQAVEVAERFADHRATNAEFEAAVAAVWGAPSISEVGGRVAASALMWDGDGESAWDTAFDQGGTEAERDALYAVADGVGELLRDVFGNPFRPISLNPAWRTPIVVHLAQAAYDERELPSGWLDAARLAVLADALESTGCADEILYHLRGPGPHLRGCWALDLLLGNQ